MTAPIAVRSAEISTATVEIRTARYPQLHDPAWLRDQYETQGRSTNEIAADLGCAQSLVWKLLRRHGIPRRREGNPAVHGQTGTPTWRSWHAMMSRCTNPSHHKWSLYGGRGVTVCARWAEPDGQGFMNFLADMGPRPEGMTIDRWPRPGGNYEPGNCRWADAITQRHNRSEP